MSITVRQLGTYFLDLLSPFKWLMAVMLWVAFFWAFDLSIRPYFFKLILNQISKSGAEPYVLWPVFAYLGMALAISVTFRLYDYFVVIKMIPALRGRIAEKATSALLEKSHSYFSNRFSGSLSNKVNDLINSVPELIQIVIDRFFSHFLAFLIAVVVLSQVHLIFGALMFGWVILFISGAIWHSKKLTRLSNECSEYGSQATGKLVDVFSNIMSVRLFSRGPYEKKLLAQAFLKAVDSEVCLQWAYFWMWMAYGFSFFFILVLNFYFLIKGFREHSISIGDFALILGINMSFVEALWQLAREFSQFSRILGKITQALNEVLTPVDVKNNPNAQIFKCDKGEIIFDNVTFHYKGIKALFEKLSVTIFSGEKVGLVGYSGSGKTTFVNLILRLYDVTDGKILIDKQDIRTVTQESLREQISMIPQDPSLFHRSLMENIRYGDIASDNDSVLDAAKRAYAHEFISKLPEAYEALVGERGVKLSGGQRQRIAIARALLKNAPILILDEATSQLDSLTEQHIQDSLWQLMQNKTTLIIAHRLSTLLRMDRILVFERGNIIEDGTHASLLAKKGLYKTLWDAQIGGFLPVNSIN